MVLMKTIYYICVLSIVSCYPACQNGGHCSTPNQCVCRPGYTGSYCQLGLYSCRMSSHIPWSIYCCFFYHGILITSLLARRFVIRSSWFLENHQSDFHEILHIRWATVPNFTVVNVWKAEVIVQDQNRSAEYYLQMVTTYRPWFR